MAMKKTSDKNNLVKPPTNIAGKAAKSKKSSGGYAGKDSMSPAQTQKFFKAVGKRQSALRMERKDVRSAAAKAGASMSIKKKAPVKKGK
jgi:hypothetical protein